MDHGVTSPGIICVNGGDEEAYRDIALPEHWEIVFQSTNLGLCGSLRWLYETLPNEPWYGLICDDEIIQTVRWDQTLIEAAGDSNLAHGNNGDPRAPIGMVIGAELVKAVGWLAPPGLWHWYIDAFWRNIALRTERLRFCENVRITHKHHTEAASPHDETYRVGESRNEEDQRVFIDWTRNEMLNTCERVRKWKTPLICA